MKEPIMENSFKRIRKNMFLNFFLIFLQNLNYCMLVS